jgi:hypothetical protein
MGVRATRGSSRGTLFLFERFSCCRARSASQGGPYRPYERGQQGLDAEDTQHKQHDGATLMGRAGPACGMHTMVALHAHFGRSAYWTHRQRSAMPCTIGQGELLPWSVRPVTLPYLAVTPDFNQSINQCYI